MPDFFEPHEPFSLSKFPPKTPEAKAEIQEFFGGPAKPDLAAQKLKKFAQALKTDGAKKVGAYGYCWGEHTSEIFLCSVLNKCDIRRKGDYLRWRRRYTFGRGLDRSPRVGTYAGRLSSLTSPNLE